MAGSGNAGGDARRKALFKLFEIVNEATPRESLDEQLRLMSDVELAGLLDVYASALRDEGQESALLEHAVMRLRRANFGPVDPPPDAAEKEALPS